MLPNGKDKSGWFIAGLGLGALAGILFAPKSGSDTRKAIATGVDHGLQHIVALGRDTRDRVNHMIDFTKKSLARKKHQADAAIDAAKKVLRRAA
jgi:gas vesicle protein